MADENNPLFTAPVNQASEPMDVHIIRHGSTQMNSDTSTDRMRGWGDVPLDEEGKKESKAVAEKMKSTDIKYLFHSDLSRAADTAADIHETTGAQKVSVPELRTWNIGQLEGAKSEDANPILSLYATHYPDVPLPGGESFNGFKDRVLSGVGMADRMAQGQPYAIVTHHKVERILNAWNKAGQPPDGTVDKKEFLAEGEEPGSIQTLPIGTKPPVISQAATPKPGQKVADTPDPQEESKKLAKELAYELFVPESLKPNGNEEWKDYHKRVSEAYAKGTEKLPESPDNPVNEFKKAFSDVANFFPTGGPAEAGMFKMLAAGMPFAKKLLENDIAIASKTVPKQMAEHGLFKEDSNVVKLSDVAEKYKQTPFDPEEFNKTYNAYLKQPGASADDLFHGIVDADKELKKAKFNKNVNMSEEEIAAWNASHGIALSDKTFKALYTMGHTEEPTKPSKLTAVKDWLSGISEKVDDAVEEIGHGTKMVLSKAVQGQMQKKYAKHFETVDWNSLEHPMSVDELKGEKNPYLKTEAGQRAQAAGFNTGFPLFKGSGEDPAKITKLPDPAKKNHERGIFYSDDPNVAKSYAYGSKNNVGIYVARSPKTLQVDWTKATGVSHYDDIYMTPMIDAARKEGADMLIVKGMYDIGKHSKQDQYVVLNPSIVRRPDAQFDPAKLKLNHLLASVGAAGVVAMPAVKGATDQQ